MKDFLKFTFATITGIIVSVVVFSFHQYSGGFQHGIIFGVGNASTQELHYDAGFEWRTG